jgi:eukaryotic-like serine/threonine-protein kinase
LSSVGQNYLQPGQRLDRYELLCPLAQGGMAQVWVARLRGKLGFEKLVAIKTVLAQHAKDRAFQEMFLNEARLIASINHPNVTEVLDLGEERDVIYFVLALIDGDSLSALRRVIHGKGERFPLNVALRIASDACAGLHAAHELRDEHGQPLGVVHRDVSPSNVLVGLGGVAKLIDFGVAKALHRLGDETASGIIKGKLSYMAPEQAVRGAVDRRADIWAMGAVLHHLLAGKPPYAGESQVEILNQLVNGRDPAPLPGVPPCVSALISRALRRNPQLRFATAEEMQRALEAALVASCSPTTSADVAAIVRTHLSERIDARKQMIERALEGAEAHARLAAELSRAVERSESSAAPPLMAPEPGPQPRRSERRRRGALAVSAVVLGAVVAGGVLLVSQRQSTATASTGAGQISAELAEPALVVAEPTPVVEQRSAADAAHEAPVAPTASAAPAARKPPPRGASTKQKSVLEVFGERH